MNRLRARPAGPVGRLHSGGRGFTLLEVVLVLFVIALASLVVYPDLRPMLEGARLESSLRKTASSFDGVRTRAVLGNATLVVAVAENGMGFVVRPEGKETESIAEIAVAAVESGAVQQLRIDPEYILYYPQGSSSGGEIAFLREGSSVARIKVGSFTGLARIVEGDGR